MAHLIPGRIQQIHILAQRHLDPAEFQLLLLHPSVQTGQFAGSFFYSRLSQLHFRIRLLAGRLRTLHGILQFLQFPSASQKVAVVPESTAADGTSCIEGLAFQRHNTERIPVARSNCQRMIHGIHHQDPPQQETDNIQIRILRMYQRISCTAYAGQLQRRSLLKSPPGLHRCQRKKSRSSQTVLFQMLNTQLRRLLIIRNHILQSAAQSRFNGSFITLFHLNQIRQNAVDPRKTGTAFHKAADTHSVSLVALRQILNRIKTCLCLMQSCSCPVGFLSHPDKLTLCLSAFFLFRLNLFPAAGNSFLNFLHGFFALSEFRLCIGLLTSGLQKLAV